MYFEHIVYHAALLSIVLLLTQSLNWIWKAGLFSLGHHAFYCIGAYTGVILYKLIEPTSALAGPETWNDRVGGLTVLAVSIAAAGVVSALAGYLLATVFSRLKDDYFAVATLVVGEITVNIIENWDFVGGSLGFEVRYLVFTNSRAESFYYVAFYALIGIILNVAVAFLYFRINRTDYGVYVAAGRNDELAAQLSGIDTRRVKRMAFSLGTGVAGMAGVLFLHFMTFVMVKDFTFVNSLPVVLFVALGYLNAARSASAAILLYCAYELLKFPKSGIGDGFEQFISDWQESLYGLLLILAVLLPAQIRRVRQRYERGRMSRNNV